MIDPLKVLDECARAFTFPALDNGYIYPAASRLSVHSGPSDWAIVIETLGINNRAGGPFLAVDTFATSLKNRNPATSYVTEEAYAKYLELNPNNDARFFEPIDHGLRIDQEAGDLTSATEQQALIRGTPVAVPTKTQLEAVGITMSDERPAVFEATRYWAETHRNLLLATDTERRVSVPDPMHQILVLDHWHHPDTVGDQAPSETQCFQMLSAVATTGNPDLYKPTEEPNTHWRHWPDGGSL